jgi:predicted DCC family thiol-disulfide oxidoreductase YuxK
VTSAPSYTLVYDGHCRVCSRFVVALGIWDRDGRIKAVASQDPGVRERFPQIAPRAFDDAIQLIDATGAVWSGAAALERVMREMPRGRWIAWALALPGAEMVYRWVARNRYRMGCSDHCARD